MHLLYGYIGNVEQQENHIAYSDGIQRSLYERSYHMISAPHALEPKRNDEGETKHSIAMAALF